MLSTASVSYTQNRENTARWRRDVFVSGREGYHTYRIPALVITSEGTVLAFCEGRKNSKNDHGDIDLLLKRSMDEGRTWTETIVVYGDGGDAPVTIGNPCPIVLRNDSSVHLLFTLNNKRLFHTSSSDDGSTWTSPREITSILDGFDYPRVLIATGPVHGLQMQNGRLIVPIWVSDREMSKRHMDEEKSRIQTGILYSDDNGRTWETGGLVPPELNRLHESTVVELSDSSLLLNIRVRDTGFRAISRSFDGGLTWSSPAIDKHLPCPVCQASMLSLGGQKVLFLNPAASSPKAYDASRRKDLTLRLSLDDARTWLHSMLVHKGPSGYSDLAATESGKILCFFENGEDAYHERLSIVGITLERLMQNHSQ